jgi:antitoxin HigA-1
MDCHHDDSAPTHPHSPGARTSQNQLAHAIGVPGNRIDAIVNGTRNITGDTELRLCKFFGLSEGYFLRLQNTYDMTEAKRRIAAQVAKIKPYKPEKAAWFTVPPVTVHLAPSSS